MANSVRRSAAMWLVRLQGDAVSEADRAAFRAWVEADPRHRAEFERVASAVEAVRQAAPALAGLRRAADENGGRAGRAWAAPAPTFAAALAACAVLAAGLGWWGFAPTSVSSAVGEQRTLELWDGSHVELNTDSAIVYRRADMVLGSSRSVRLDRGEAFFEVVHDAQRPFEVEAGDARVRVLGTRFAVSLAEDGAVAVLVSEGLVAMAPTHAGEDASEIVNAGELLRLTQRSAERASLDGAEIERRLAWRSGMLQFNGQPLAVVTAEVTRHTGAVFAFADPDIAREPFVAYFRANDLDGFLAQLAPNLRVERARERIVISRRESP
ncbi:MAG TPA: FecR domain-containing protein [Vitreimonas sp.]|uniref:FecR family protein n=1 Tax=Vitreimonas sp. TaxID=3069702 RepID=UPI002D6D4658|nr:FecR domain-containing protein [Vitreimonas sp.]HYD86054.1 FecR domain-containing protein [Vitreimonas sp.]